MTWPPRNGMAISRNSAMILSFMKCPINFATGGGYKYSVIGALVHKNGRRSKGSALPSCLVICHKRHMIFFVSCWQRIY